MLELGSGLGSWLDFGARMYDPAIGRFTGVDALADHPNQLDKSPYAYAWNDPIGLNDPDGNCPLCPIIKGAAGAAVDYFIQGALNYAGGMPADQAFSPSNIDLGDVAISGLQGALPWTVPGGKYGKAAGAALMDVGINAGKAALSGEGYTIEQAGVDFLTGFAAQLGAEKVDELFGNRSIVPGEDEGVIYQVAGSDTPSGKDYIGSSDDLDQRARTARDGRNRSNAKIIDTYPRGNRKARRQAEQRGINRKGGKENLDNKRDEITRKKWKDNKIDPPRGGNKRN